MNIFACKDTIKLEISKIYANIYSNDDVKNKEKQEISNRHKLLCNIWL